MNDFDLTLNRVFTRRPTTNLISSNLFEEFDDKKTETLRKGVIYVGSANDIHLQKQYEGFGENNGTCDRCGGLIMPWVKMGVCEKCTNHMDYEDNEMPEFLRRNNSFEKPEVAPWFIV